MLSGVVSALACTSATPEPQVESFRLKYLFVVSVVGDPEIAADLARKASNEVSVDSQLPSFLQDDRTSYTVLAYFDSPEEGTAFCDSVASAGLEIEYECRSQGVSFEATIANSAGFDVRVRAYCRERGPDGLIEREIPVVPDQGGGDAKDALGWRVRGGHRRTVKGHTGTASCSPENLEIEMVPIEPD